MSLRIGEIAASAGVPTRTIRFYEAAGVIPPAPRGANGYRVYAADTVDLLRFVRQAQTLGLSLDEIREIVTIRRGGRPPCPHVRALLVHKVAELNRRLGDLVALRRRIRRSLAAWRRAPRGRGAVCPHIERRPEGARGRSGRLSGGR